MRVAVVTESYLPQVNGVTNPVVRATAELRSRGHQVIVISPGRKWRDRETADVVRTAAVSLPGYREVKVGWPPASLTTPWSGFGPTSFTSLRLSPWVQQHSG